MSRASVCFVLVVFMLVAAAPLGALEQKPVLTLDMAKKMADACEAARNAAGWRPINIAIYDGGGNLTLFRRQDNAFLGSIQIAQLKGHTSAMFPIPTRMLGEIAFGKEGQAPRAPGIAYVPGLASFPGGLPIVTPAGQRLGAIGVSGATGDEDEMCAKAAIDAIAAMLKE
ncbi:MAG: heme-binding protein [Candidatus Tectomicrobia bacterium]